MEELVLIGLGGHAKSVIDSIELSEKYKIAGYIDQYNKGEYRGYHWLGTDDILQKIFDEGIQNAFISIGYTGKGNVRDKLYKILKDIGYSIPSIVDPTAIISKNTILGEGVFIGKRAVVNSDSRIGKMCIINTGAIVEHENIIGDFTHIAVGAVLCGNVVVGSHSMVGAGVTIIQNCKIGSYSLIGANTIICDKVDDGVSMVGERKCNKRKREPSY